MKYTLTISQQEKGPNNRDEITNVNIITQTEPLAVCKDLARCYRDASPKTCENDRVLKAKAWITLGQEGAHLQKFRFICKGWAPGITYIYEWEFSGVEL